MGWGDFFNTLIEKGLLLGPYETPPPQQLPYRRADITWECGKYGSRNMLTIEYPIGKSINKQAAATGWFYSGINILSLAGIIKNGAKPSRDTATTECTGEGGLYGCRNFARYDGWTGYLPPLPDCTPASTRKTTPWNLRT